MKTTVLSLAILLTTAVCSQVIYIPFSSAPNLDGKVGSAEWNAANAVNISIQGGSNAIPVFFMHDSSSIYIAYQGNLQSSNIRFPEVLIDLENDKSAGWMNDDWWFHVSATDCEYQGQHSNYDSCMLVRPNWTGVPNFNQSPPPTDTVEIAIPFATIGLDLSVHDTIGISFEVATLNTWEYWPSGADIDIPSTWGSAVFKSISTGISEKNGVEELRIFPNPARDYIMVQGLQKAADYIITDLTGKTVLGGRISPNENRISVEGLNPGVYVVTLGEVRMRILVAGH